MLDFIVIHYYFMRSVSLDLDKINFSYLLQ